MSEREREQRGQYDCEACGTTFNSKNELDQHNQQVHGKNTGEM